MSGAVGKGTGAVPDAHRGRTGRLWIYGLALWPVLIQVPVALQLPLPYLPYIAFALICLVAIKKNPEPTADFVDYRLTLLAANIITLVFSLIAANELQYNVSSKVGLAVLIVTFVWFTASASVRTFAAGGRYDVVDAFLISLPIYAIVMLISPAIDPSVVIYSGSQNTILSLVGIEFGRISSANLSGGISGVAIIALVYFWQSRKLKRSTTLALGLATVALLAISDSRAMAVLAIFCVLIATMLSPRRLSIAGKLSLIAATTSPIWLYSLFTTLGSEGPDWIARGGELGTRLGAGTGRLYVWDVAFIELGQFKLEHIFGFGLGGHITSGIAARYQWIFPEDLTPHTLHNFTLQTIFDRGFLGIAIYFSVVWATFGAISKSNWLSDLQSKSLLSIVIFIILGGMTEITGSLYHLGSSLIMMAIFAFALIRKSSPAVEETTLSVPDASQRVSTTTY